MLLRATSEAEGSVILWPCGIGKERRFKCRDMHQQEID